MVRRFAWIIKFVGAVAERALIIRNKIVWQKVLEIIIADPEKFVPVDRNSVARKQLRRHAEVRVVMQMRFVMTRTVGAFVWMNKAVKNIAEDFLSVLRD
jgi:hypothetical protein